MISGLPGRLQVALGEGAEMERGEAGDVHVYVHSMFMSYVYVMSMVATEGIKR